MSEVTFDELLQVVKENCKNDAQHYIGIPTTRVLQNMRAAFKDKYIDPDQAKAIINILCVVIVRDMFSTGTVDKKEITKLMMELEDATSTH